MFSRSIDSPLFTLQDKMVTCQLWRHMRPFVRITAIMDPPSWIFWQSPPLLQNYRKLISKKKRKVNYQKKKQTKNFKKKSSIFRLTCLSKLGFNSNATCHIKTISKQRSKVAEIIFCVVYIIFHVSFSANSCINLCIYLF